MDGSSWKRLNSSLSQKEEGRVIYLLLIYKCLLKSKKNDIINMYTYVYLEPEKEIFSLLNY